MIAHLCGTEVTCDGPILLSQHSEIRGMILMAVASDGRTCLDAGPSYAGPYFLSHLQHLEIGKKTRPFPKPKNS